MQQHLFNNFCTSRHAGFFDDVFETFIDKTDCRVFCGVQTGDLTVRSQHLTQ